MATYSRVLKIKFGDGSNWTTWKLIAFGWTWKKGVKRPDILHPTFLDLGVHGGQSPRRFSKRWLCQFEVYKLNHFAKSILRYAKTDKKPSAVISQKKKNNKKTKKQKKRKERPQAWHKAELDKLNRTTSVNTISCFYIVEQIKKRLKWNKT